MDEFEEYRARANSMNSAEIVRMNSSMKGLKCVDKTYVDTCDGEDFMADTLSDAESTDLDDYFRPRVSSAGNDFTQSFAGLGLRQKYCDKSSQMYSDDKTHVWMKCQRRDVMPSHCEPEPKCQEQMENCAVLLFP